MSAFSSIALYGKSLILTEPVREALSLDIILPNSVSIKEIPAKFSENVL